MPVPTRPTHGGPQSDCLRKTEFRTKKAAKQAAARRTGPTEVYECPWPNRNGSAGTHWHYAHRRKKLKRR